MVVAGGRHFVGFEQPDTQQQRQWHITFDRMEDARVVLHGPQRLFQLLNPLFRHQIAFVQQQDVAIDHLGPTHLRVEHGFVEVFGIDQRDDRIKACRIAQLAAQERHGHRQRIGEPRCFHNDVVHRLRAFEDPLHSPQELVVDRAADAAIAELHGVVIRGDDQIVVDSDLTELVHQHGGFHTLLIAEDVIQQGGFARPQKAAENGDGNAGGRGRGGHPENASQVMLAAARRLRLPVRRQGC